MSARAVPPNSKSKSASQPPSNVQDKLAFHPAVIRVLPLIRRRDYHAAAKQLRSAGRDLSIRNTLGVCLLRIGLADEALQVFRQFVLTPGNLGERGDVSDAQKRNFATALLLSGSPSGAIDVLREIKSDDQRQADQIRRSIRQWEKSLGWLRWIDWKLNRIEPPNCRVQVDFVPGEFDTGVEGDAAAEPEVTIEQDMEMTSQAVSA
ncbi:tetratricopeptide repeat protein [Roseiconus lacunae]|uniref:tetratricopeptide repeat protein n=1 Tax=Roseiconus lacunae TaxID=2605694 RepID=UPI0030899197|nr:tetratricopeptide repeat protein [Stieleria sp. HD01]